MNHHAYFAAATGPVETCIVGTGGFGRSFLAQGLRVPLMNVRVAVDVTAEIAAEAMQAVGIAAENIRICTDAGQAKAAWETGAFIAAADLASVIDLPVDVIVEATGHPEAGARHARIAVEAGRHVALVSKEVDSVVGPGLSSMARQNGRVVTPVDGDQPSLLIGLVTWAEALGFEIIAAGKSSEYDFVYDPQNGTLTSNGRVVHAPDFAAHLELGAHSCTEVGLARSASAASLPQRAVPDLCELAVAANAIGFDPDRPDLHAPIARIAEVPDFFSTQAEGGLLSGTRRLDVFHCLRLPGEISFAGGVFVVVRCDDRSTWQMLADKGHVLSRGGSTAMIFLPRHLLGLEAATSILEAAVRGVSSGSIEPRHHLDLIAQADVDLPAGTRLSMGGHHHMIDGVSARLVPAGRLAADVAVPFYLTANRDLVRPVIKGHPIVLEDLLIDPASELMALRRRQDEMFFGTSRETP